MIIIYLLGIYLSFIKVTGMTSTFRDVLLLDRTQVAFLKKET